MLRFAEVMDRSVSSPALHSYTHLLLRGAGFGEAGGRAYVLSLRLVTSQTSDISPQRSQRPAAPGSANPTLSSRF